MTAAPPTTPRAPVVALRSPRDIAALDRAAAIACAAARAAVAACRPGATTALVSDTARDTILRLGARAAFEGYTAPGIPAPFPAAACVSVNDEAVHTPPGPRVLAPGDLVTVDVGVEFEGWFGDVAESVCIPPVTDESRRLLMAARRAVARAVRAAQPGTRWSLVARAVRAALASEGLMALPGYSGHGVGRALHEPPRAPYDARPGAPSDFLLLPGMVLTIEPVVVGPPGVVAAEGWSVRTADASPACHVERMIAITRRGARILGRAPAGLGASRGL